MPERLRAELEKAETELKAMGTSTEEADEHLALRKANELCTLAEAFAAKGVIRGESASAKLLANTEKVFRDLPISILPDAGILRLAGNERGGFQLLLIPGEKIGEYSMESGNLESEEGASIPASEITLNPVAYVEVLNSFIYPGSRPGWWPDPLLDNRPMLLDQKVQPVWVTIRVPENQPKGRYSGKLVVRNEARESVLEVPYSIDVRGFSLPKTAALQNLISCVYRPEDGPLRRKLYAMLLDYRVNPINMYINAGTEMGYQPEREDLQFCGSIKKSVGENGPV